jgi:TRAP-type C4-dicarboxylate transport system substrate-binding protein
MIVTEFPSAEAAQWRQKLKPVVDKFAKDAGESIVKEMYAEIEKARGH